MLHGDLVLDVELQKRIEVILSSIIFAEVNGIIPKDSLVFGWLRVFWKWVVTETKRLAPVDPMVAIKEDPDTVFGGIVKNTTKVYKRVMGTDKTPIPIQVKQIMSLLSKNADGNQFGFNR